MSKEMLLFDDKYSITIPDSYREAGKDEISKYGFTMEPDYVFIDPENRSCIAVKRGEYELQDEDIKKRLQEYYRVYERTTPGFEGGQLAVRDGDGYSVGAVNFKSTTLTSDVYNMAAITAVDNREIVCTMHSDMQYAMDVARIFMDVANSIKIIRK